LFLKKIFEANFFLNGETNQKRESAREGLCYLRAAIFMAKKMGEDVGRSEVLQRAVPEEEGLILFEVV